jgi:hypothetical protein
MEAFRKLGTQVLSVSREEIQRREEEYQRQRKAKASASRASGDSI